MKYSEHGFRPLYKNFCIYPLSSVMLELLGETNAIEEAQGVMTYGYVDHVAGNMLELIALTRSEGGGKYSFVKLPESKRYTVKISDVMDEEFEFVNYGNSHLYQRFRKKIDVLAPYDMDARMVKTRSFAFLDSLRHELNLDDVKVVLYSQGQEVEGVWAKIESYEKGIFLGTLLNDPTGPFEIKAGMPIAFIANEDVNKAKSLVADLSPRKKPTADDLADGTILKKALEAFGKDANQTTLYNVLELLKQSIVYIPYSENGVAIMSSEQSYFYPAFSSRLEMEEFGPEIVKKESMLFVEALKHAKENQQLMGIVINAFTDAVVIPRSMFSLIERI